MDDGAVDGGEVGLRSVKPSTPNSEGFDNTERGNQCWRVKKSSGLAFYLHGLDHYRARDWGRLWGVLAVHKLHL